MTHEEGTDILDPELKAALEQEERDNKVKVEKLREINADITTAITDLMDKHDLKIYMAAYTEELDEVGVWKSENMSAIEEMGLAKIIENQF